MNLTKGIFKFLTFPPPSPLYPTWGYTFLLNKAEKFKDVSYLSNHKHVRNRLFYSISFDLVSVPGPGPGPGPNPGPGPGPGHIILIQP